MRCGYTGLYIHGIAALNNPNKESPAQFDNTPPPQWLTAAREKFGKKDYAGTEQLLQTMLRSANARYNTYWKGRDEVLRMLAVSYCQLEMWEEAMLVLDEDFAGKDKEVKAMAEEFCVQGRVAAAKHLLAIEFDGKEKILELYAKRAYWNLEWEESADILVRLLHSYEAKKDNVSGLRIMQALAEVRFASGEIDEALEVCLKVTSGRKEKLGPRHVLFYQSINLLALIYEARSDSVEAGRYKRLLPDDFKGIIPSNTR